MPAACFCFRLNINLSNTVADFSLRMLGGGVDYSYIMVNFSLNMEPLWSFLFLPDSGSLKQLGFLLYCISLVCTTCLLLGCPKRRMVRCCQFVTVVASVAIWLAVYPFGCSSAESSTTTSWRPVFTVPASADVSAPVIPNIDDVSEPKFRR